MTKYLFYAMSLLLLAASCNGQEKTHKPAGESLSPTEKAAKRPPSVSTLNSILGMEPDRKLMVSEYIRRMYQDKAGNIWFGTQGDGVARYDGQTLQYFSTNDGFGGRVVRGIAEDKNGNIWFGTEAGVTKFDPIQAKKSGEKPFTNYSNADGLAGTDVWSLYIDKAGYVWAGTIKGVFRHHTLATHEATEKAFTPFKIPFAKVENPPSRFSPDLVWSFLEDKNGNMWFGSDGSGISKYNPAAKTFVNFTEKEGLASNNVGSILEDRNGTIWFGTRFGGLSKYDPKNEEKAAKLFTNYTTEDGLSNNFIYTMIEDSKGRIWISSHGGDVIIYHPSASRTFDKQHLTYLSKKDGLNNLHVQSILEDRSGFIWLGSGAGLFRYNGKTVHYITKNGP